MRFRPPGRPVCVVVLAALSAAAVPMAHAQLVPPASAVSRLPTPLTLQEALSIALRQQPQQYIARTQTTQARGQRTQAQALYYPTLTPTYQFGVNRQTFYGRDLGGGLRDRVNESQGGTGVLALRQNIYDGGRRELTNAQSRRSLEGAAAGEANARQQIILGVTQTFYDLLRAVDLVRVAQAQVARAQQIVDLTQAQIDAGVVARKDIYQSRADLANAQVSLLQNRNLVRTTSASLKNAMGVETDDVVQPAPLATATGQLPAVPDAGPQRTLAQYVQQAYVSRPDLRQQRSSVAISELAVKRARIEAGVLITSDYALDLTPINDRGSKGTDSRFAVTGSYPLFDAGFLRAAVRIAQAQRDAAKDQLEQLRQNVRLDVEQGYVQRTEALERTRLAQTAVEAAQVNFDAARAARREGAATVIDVTQAQLTLTQAQNQYVTAIYDFYTADARLRRAIGQNEITASGTTGP